MTIQHRLGCQQEPVILAPHQRTACREPWLDITPSFYITTMQFLRACQRNILLSAKAECRRAPCAPWHASSLLTGCSGVITTFPVEVRQCVWRDRVSCVVMYMHCFLVVALCNSRAGVGRLAVKEGRRGNCLTALIGYRPPTGESCCHLTPSQTHTTDGSSLEPLNLFVNRRQTCCA